MRLFLAIELDDNVKDLLAQTADALRSRSVRGNFTHRENFHLTLVFLGETDRVSAVRHAMHAVQSPPFSMRIGGSGVFRRTGGDIYWAGVKPNDALRSVYDTLSDALRDAGFRLENRPYTPHLTLGREVVLQKGAAALPTVPETDVKVNAITLMRSDRIQGKLTYTPVYRKML